MQPPRPEPQQLELQPQKVEDLSKEKYFTVEVGSSPQLEELKKQARSLRDLPFIEKLETLKKLSTNPLKNVYDLEPNLSGVAVLKAQLEKSARIEDILKKEQTLSYALEKGYGCCRYQALLFFLLSIEAGLGSTGMLLTKRVFGNFFSVFNVVFDEKGNRHAFSLFNDSLLEGNSARYNMDLTDYDIVPNNFSSQQDYPYYVKESSEIQIYKVSGKNKRKLLGLYAQGIN